MSSDQDLKSLSDELETLHKDVRAGDHDLVTLVEKTTQAHQIFQTLRKLYTEKNFEVRLLRLTSDQTYVEEPFPLDDSSDSLR